MSAEQLEALEAELEALEAELAALMNRYHEFQDAVHHMVVEEQEADVDTNLFRLVSGLTRAIFDERIADLEKRRDDAAERRIAA